METEHIETTIPDADVSKPGALTTFVTGLFATVQPDVINTRRHITDLQQARPA